MELFWITFTVFLSLLTVSLHELGHAWAMHRYRVPIDEISLLGMKIPGAPYLSFLYTLPGALRPTKISLHPFLVGAYVKGDIKTLESLPTRDQAFIFGAGPFVNFLYCLLVYGMLAFTHPSGDLGTVGAICVAIAALFTVFRTFVCRYGVLIIGILFTALILWSLFMVTAKDSGAVGGPVTIVSDMSSIYKANASVDNHLRGAILISVLVSLALGTTNALPLPPLDGGQIAHRYLSAWNAKAGTYFAGAGVIAFLVLIVTALSHDVGILIGR